MPRSVGGAVLRFCIRPFGRVRLCLMDRSSDMARRNQRYALEASRLASERAATKVHGEMTKGLGILATIASTAPLIGVLGTVMGIPSAFIGCAGEAWTCRAAVVIRLSISIWPTALSVIVALAALCFYKHLRTRVEMFDSEMHNASLCLRNDLSRCLPSTNT